MSDAAVVAGTPPVSAPLSRRLALGGAIAIFATGVVGLLPLGEVSQIGGQALFGLFMLAGVAILASVVNRFERGSAVRRQWELIAAGVILGVLGDVIYIVQSGVTSSSPPFPSWATPVYLIQYVFLLAGLVLAASAYRMFIPLSKPAALATALSAVVAAAVLWFEVSVAFQNIAGSMRTEALVFTVADIMLMFAPALFVILVIRQVGGAKLSAPWLSVAAGAILFATGDVGNFTLGAFSGEVDLSFALVGMSRMASALAFVVAAVMAREAFTLST